MKEKIVGEKKTHTTPK